MYYLKFLHNKKFFHIESSLKIKIPNRNVIHPISTYKEIYDSFYTYSKPKTYHINKKN